MQSFVQLSKTYCIFAGELKKNSVNKKNEEK